MKTPGLFLAFAFLVLLSCPGSLAGQDAPDEPSTMQGSQQKMLIDAPLSSPGNDKPKAPPEVQRVAQGSNAFAFRILPELSKGKPGNLFFSPFSIHLCFGMPFVGAAGTTADEIEKLMGYPVKDRKLGPEFGAYLRSFPGVGSETPSAADYEMSIANAAWAEKSYPFNPKFVVYVKKVFASDFHLCDFKSKADEVRQEINSWVARITRDKIKDLLPEGILTPLTRLVLVNAIYFKGKWKEEFEKAATVDKPFFQTPEKSFPVPMMQKTFSIPYFENESLQMIGLPYKGDEIRMYVVLPRTKTGLPAIENSLSAKTFDEMVRASQSWETVLSLPRFKLETRFSLPEALKAVGLKEAFTDKADFSRLLEPGKNPAEYHLVISEVIHKAFVAVDEEGTEAAAATAIIMDQDTCSANQGPPPKVFLADHPFLFFLRHEATSTILFMGRMANPKES